MTKTERKILLSHLFQIFAWGFVIAVYIYFFSLHFFIGLIHAFLIPIIIWILISNQVYVPVRGYFFRFFFQHTKEERNMLNQEILSGKCPRLGKAVFLEKYVLIISRGVILNKGEIQRIEKNVVHIKRSEKNQSYQVTLTFFCKQSPQKEKYRFYCSPKEYTTIDENYENAVKWLYHT